MSTIDEHYRCHDTACGQRERCERWLSREKPGPGVRHATTLKPAWQCHEDACAWIVMNYSVWVETR